MNFRKYFGVSTGGYLLAVGIGVIMGVISYAIVANVTAGITPAPTGLNALIIGYIPTFLALAIMMLPVGALWIGGMA